MRKIVIVGIIVGLALTLGSFFTPVVSKAAGQEIKIGVLDLQQAINDSQKGKAAKAMLMKKFERLQNELSAQEKEIEKMQQDLERQASMLSQEAKLEKDRTIKRKIRDFQEQYRDYSQEMQREEFENTKPIVEGLLKVANEYGKEKGYTLVLEAKKAGVIYAPDALDITAEVMKRYDAQAK